jgi:hypothetical protein
LTILNHIEALSIIPDERISFTITYRKNKNKRWKELGKDLERKIKRWEIIDTGLKKSTRKKKMNPNSASADGGPRHWVCACKTLPLAPNQH